MRSSELAERLPPTCEEAKFTPRPQTQGWHKRNRLSQRAAVAVLQKHYFHITFASLRSWEEGRRFPHPHTAEILEKFLNDHPTVLPPK
jgi:hypothetical protein